MYICICNISYKLTQKHIAWYKFLTIFKERKIERKKRKNKNKNRFGAKRKKNKQNYTVLLYYEYLYIICTY